MLMELNSYIKNKTIYQERNRDVTNILLQDDKPLILKDINFGNDIRKIVIINDVNYTNQKVIELLIKYIDVYNETIKNKLEVSVEDVYVSLIKEMKK